jgi:hypothetical protein
MADAGEQAAAALAPHDRVRQHSADRVNARIDAETAARIREVEAAGPAAILRRIRELDGEWDVDRALMANFALVGGTVFALGATRMRRSRGRWNGWMTFVSIQLAFLLQHAVRGWCPPLPVFRRLGFRTGKEIAREREALVSRLATVH